MKRGGAEHSVVTYNHYSGAMQGKVHRPALSFFLGESVARFYGQFPSSVCFGTGRVRGESHAMGETVRKLHFLIIEAYVLKTITLKYET